MKNIKEIIIGLLVVTVVVMGLQINKLNTDLKATKAQVSSSSNKTPGLSFESSSIEKQIMDDWRAGKIRTFDEIAKLFAANKTSSLKQQSASAYADYCDDWIQAYFGAMGRGDIRSAEVYYNIAARCVAMTME